MNGDDRAKTHNTPKVEISVRNFGPIAEADLDLRPLTVFVGPSNTGKTYLSVLIYALQRVFEDFSGFPSLHILPLLAHGLKYDSPVEAEEPFKSFDKLSEVLNKLEAAQPLKYSDLPKEVRKQIQSKLKNLEIYGNNLEKELKRCFDSDSVSGLIRSSGNQSNEITVSLVISQENQDFWSFKMRASESRITADGQINENNVIFPQDQSSFKLKIDPFKRTLALIPELHRSIGKPYYLPAARSGIMQSHRVITSSLVTRSTRAGLEALEVPTLSGVVADFMQELILYRERAGSEDGINHLADALESEVLDGQIIMKPSPTGYPEFLYRPQETGQDIRLTRSSSMVSELAPLLLYIRGLVQSGATLIIEEPEAHLHPAAQTQMAATFARLVRAGVRVIVTTHSDFMLKEIANLMHEGELEEKGALKKQANKPERWLLPEEVGVWLFQKNGIVDEIQFDRIHGIEPIEYEDVVEALYNRWAGLQNRIEELKDESELECE